MATLTKADLITMAVEKIGISRYEAKDLIEHCFEIIREGLESGEDVMLSGFGKFKLLDKVARPGRNPRTGEEYEIGARRVVSFHPSGKLKEKVAEYQGETGKE